MIRHSMKSNTLYLLVVFILGAGCQSQDGHKKSKSQKKRGDTIVIAGNVKSPRGQKIRLKHPAAGPRNFATAKLSEDGSFHKPLSLEEPAYFSLKQGKQNLSFYAEPGDSIYVNFNARQIPQSIQFSGHHSFENQYLAKKAKMKDSLNLLSRKSQKNLYQKKPDNFLQEIESIENQYQDFFKNYFDQSSSNRAPAPTFEKFEKASNKFLFYRMKESYPLIYQRLNRGQKPDLPEDYYAYQEKAPFDDADLLNIPSFRGYAKTRLNVKSREAGQNNINQNKGKATVLMNTVKKEFDNDTIKAQILGEVLLQQLKRGSMEGLEEAMAYYEELPYRKAVHKKLKKKQESLKALKKGKPAPGFTYPNLEGEMVSLKDFKGSYVYIDAWATWCGPCIKEIPQLKKLHDRFKDENIEFVSISLDKSKDKQKWKQMVNNKNLKGHQLYAKGKAFKAKLAQDYMINSIPRFILIDPEGKIVDANAPRPSGNIGAKLNELLGG